MGFLIMSSFGNGYRLTGNPAYSDVVVQAATSLATRYSATVGATRSWNDPTNFLVIIDNMMNLELLDYAAGLKGGNPIWRDMALAHSLTTARTLVHADGSVTQEATFDNTTGALLDTSNSAVHLGDHDVWARGQAWALDGFATQYRYLRDPRLLDTARSVADYFLAHLPADSIPRWNLNDPTESWVQDSSAAAIAASGLAQLALVDPDPTHQATYRAGAARLLAALTSPANLDTTVTGAGLLKHASQLWNGPQSDTAVVYADYYLLEAIERFRMLPTTLTPIPVLSVVGEQRQGRHPGQGGHRRADQHQLERPGLGPVDPGRPRADQPDRPRGRRHLERRHDPQPALRRRDLARRPDLGARLRRLELGPDRRTRAVRVPPAAGAVRPGARPGQHAQLLERGRRAVGRLRGDPAAVLRDHGRHAHLRGGDAAAPRPGQGVRPGHRRPGRRLRRHAGLREWYAEGDLDELEYAAMGAAARASLSLLADDPEPPAAAWCWRRTWRTAAVRPGARRRARDARPGERRGARTRGRLLRLCTSTATRLNRWWGTPRMLLQAAADGDEDAQFAVDSAEDESLLWYAVQEADDLLQGASTEPGSGRG